MMDDRKDDANLDLFFQAARDVQSPGDDLTARVLADAALVQAGLAASVAAAASADAARPAWLEALGGWFAVSGLAAACAMGVMMGVVLPTALEAGLDGGLGVLLGDEASVGFAGFEAVSFADDFEVNQ